MTAWPTASRSAATQAGWRTASPVEGARPGQRPSRRPGSPTMPGSPIVNGPPILPDEAEFLSVDVVVIGGGLIGLTLGHALASGGLETAIVDSERPVALADDAHDGRASAIAHGSQRVLATLGLWDQMAVHAAPILDIRVSDGGFETGASRLFLHYDHNAVGAPPRGRTKEGVVPTPSQSPPRGRTKEGGVPTPSQSPPLGHIVENRFIRRALYQHLPKAEALRLIAPARVVNLERGPGEVVAELADGRRIRAGLAIAADGRSSPMRKQARIAVTEWAYGQTAIVCTVAHEHEHRNVAHERFLPAGPLPLPPLPGPKCSLVWAPRP